MRRVVLRTPDPSVFRALQYLACEPEIAGYAADDLEIVVEPFRDRYRILEQGRAPNERLTTETLAEYLHARITEMSIEDKPAAPLLHAASLRCNGRRILLVGPKNSGKTTLTLRLVASGYQMEGDENVFVTARGVIARPRACRVKEATLGYLPDIAALLSHAPCITDYLGRRIYNIDPRLLGASWRIEEGPVDLVVVLRPNHGGYSSIRPLKPLALTQELMSEAGLPPRGRGAAVACIALLSAKAEGFDLSLGALDGAMRGLDRLLAGAA